MLIVARWKVRPLVRAARLLAAETGVDHRLRHVEHERELDRRDALGVECPALILDHHAGKSLLQRAQRGRTFAERLTGAIDTGAVLHGFLHRVANRSDALAT